MFLVRQTILQVLVDSYVLHVIGVIWSDTAYNGNYVGVWARYSRRIDQKMEIAVDRPQKERHSFIAGYPMQSHPLWQKGRRLVRWHRTVEEYVLLESTWRELKHMFIENKTTSFQFYIN